jgi:receptor expression-enhancing protein 5/6
MVFLRGVAERLPRGKTFVAELERKTGVAVEHVLIGVECLMLILLYSGIGAVLITNLVGFVYPAYSTLLSLETKKEDADARQDYKHWLAYWVVFCTLTVMDPFVEYVVLYWIPYFYPVKVAFLLWLMLPSQKGMVVVSKKIYDMELLGSRKAAAATAATASSSAAASVFSKISSSSGISVPAAVKSAADSVRTGVVDSAASVATALQSATASASASSASASAESKDGGGSKSPKVSRPTSSKAAAAAAATDSASTTEG